MINPQSCATFACLGFAVVATLAAAVATIPADSDAVAAIFPPWWTAGQVLAAAGTAGDAVGLGRLPFGVVVHGEPKTLAARLRAMGALVILNAAALPGCGASTRKQAAPDDL